MRVLIIGCGYVGLPLGTELARRGHKVFGLRRSPSAAGEVESAGIHSLIADITKPEELANLPFEFDWVVNCVASSGAGAQDYRRVYLDGMRNVIEWLVPIREKRPREASAPRFVYTSSTSVYGQNNGEWVEEGSPTEPTAETARVLLDSERTLLAAAQQRNFSATILRLAGIYGPERGYWFRRFVAGDARLDGKGERFLNMIHRDDVVGCITSVLAGGNTGNIYNAVDDEPVSQFDFFSWLATALQKPTPPSGPEITEARKRGVTNKRVSNKKLKSELGYRFKYPSFREGFASEIQRLSQP